MLTASACSQATEADPASDDRAAQPLASAVVAAPAIPDDRPSQQAIAVFWQTKSTTRANSLSARVQNATDASKLVALQLVGTDPYGRTVTRAIGTRSVGAKAGLDFDVKLADLPVQSAGLASQLVLTASYELELQTPDGARKKQTHQVHSGAVYVTFTESFGQAAVHSVGEQASLNSAQARAGVQTALKLRHYNQSSSRLEELSTARSALAAPDGAPLALTSVIDGTFGSAPSSN